MAWRDRGSGGARLTRLRRGATLLCCVCGRIWGLVSGYVGEGQDLGVYSFTVRDLYCRMGLAFRLSLLETILDPV